MTRRQAATAIAKPQGTKPVAAVPLRSSAPVAVAVPASASPASVRPAATAKPEKKRANTEGVSATLTLVILTVVLVIGWSFRNTGFVTPESGLGYALGIVGSSMMAIMLIYPFRKRLGSLRVLGPVKHWFRAHMMLGVVGPTLVVLHTNFSLGSANGRVALFCMVVVALSGLAGRYLYRQIHNGLYGQRLTLRDLQTQSESQRRDLQAASAVLPEVSERLQAYERGLDQPCPWLVDLLRPSTVQFATRLMKRRLLRDIGRALATGAQKSAAVARQRHRLLEAATRHVEQRLRICRRIVMFRSYERLFSLWHVAHIPLFLLMALAAVVHIYAVHAY